MDLYEKQQLFKSKTILAPMVKAGRTPLRVLALEYGADLVYTEEIVDQRLLSCKRIKNDCLNTVDFMNGDDVVLRIASIEKEKCVLQIGSNSPENAAEICRRFSNECMAIDLNMGCPKPFSVHSGMGAALLSDPVRAKEHVKTMEFVKMLESCGLSAIAVHGRQRNERPNNECRYNELRDVSRYCSIPIIANGGSSDIQTFKNIEEFKERTEAKSVMIARSAFTNPSIFCANGLKSMPVDISNFLEKASQFDENYTAAKYVVQRILGSQQEFDPKGKATVNAATLNEICSIWGVTDERRRINEQQLPQENNFELIEKVGGGLITFTLSGGIWLANLSFAPARLKRGVAGASTPKCILHNYCRENHLSEPLYLSTKRREDGRFTAIVSVAEKRFSSPISQPNIRMAEQGRAAISFPPQQSATVQSAPFVAIHKK
uniref:Dus domain-containing protein n=1 Tax=Meloidogyne hapla TaxID=6305 RepID=A0A1I8BUI7_MELHA